MTRFGLFFCTTLLAVGGVGVPLVHAAEKEGIKAPDPCQQVYEEIVPLRVPDFDQAALWKKISGVKGIERPRALLPVVDGGQILIGSSVPYDEKTGLASPQIQMVRTDRTGKIVVEKWQSLKNLKTVADGILLKNRVVVLAQTGDDKGDDINLVFLNGVGDIKSNAVIHDTQLRLIPKSIVSVPGGTKMVIAAEAVSRKNPADSYTILIWTDKDGKKTEQKEYLPGVVNRPEYIGRLQGGEMVVTGRVKTEDGRDAGWILRVNEKGDILYQRPYARGGDSVLRRAVQMKNGDIIAVGDALPAREGDKAGWAMRVNDTGKPVWQKYLTGTYGYSGVDISVLDDGRLNMVLAGKRGQTGGRDFARIVTLSQDGVIIGDESFIEGSNAIPARMILQGGRRYLLGLAETGFSRGETPDDLKYITYDSWVMGLADLPVFKNNCAGAPDRTLDDLP